MPSHDPRAIANEFIQRNGGNIDQMKLHKLVYLAHAWNLAINHEPLVSGRIEAWDNGPAMRSIWNHLRDFGTNADGLMVPPRGRTPFHADLTTQELDVIDRVWQRYGSYTNLDLCEVLVTYEAPWGNAYFGKGRNTALLNSDIRAHTVELALAGRRAEAINA